jgi:hypothetical protein
MTEIIEKNYEDKQSKLYLEKEGEMHIQHILEVIENEPWGVSLLQLSWSAGPITFFALQGGYLLGYGKTAPMSLFTYFAGYTLIAGVFGLIASVINKITKERNKKDAERNYLYVIDKLIDLIYSFTNYRLSMLTKNDRKAESAKILLTNSHAFPDSIAIATLDLTGDSHIAELGKQIEVFRRSGLSSRVKDLIGDSREKIENLLLELQNTYPEAAYFLDLRFKGDAPSLKVGIPRIDGFLKRIYLSAEYGDFSMMTIRDAEEFLLFVYELINGRRLSVLNFTYIGNKKLNEAARSLEKYRAAYRSIKATVNYRTEMLYTVFTKYKLINVGKKLSLAQKYNLVYEHLNMLCEEFLQSETNAYKQRSSTINLALLKKALYYHSLLVKNYKFAQVTEKKLEHAIVKWRTISNKYDDKKTEFRYGRGKRGLRISNKIIYLDDNSKITLSNKLAGLIDELDNEDINNEHTIKEFAISLLLEMPSSLELDNPTVQYGIDSVNSINLGSIEQGISVQAKALWTANMVEELKKNTSRSAEQLARALVDEYDEDLDDDAIDFLETKYGARKSVLRQIKQSIPPKINDKLNYRDIPITKIKSNPSKWKKVEGLIRNFDERKKMKL